eukprot:GHVU01114117.1.p1 GENE.GHVU01114117.1~~GHVU01114117.1.p1  ORF type:complete len:156 (+),score=14.20 GHVU01114117.1:339-806(+)
MHPCIYPSTPARTHARARNGRHHHHHASRGHCHNKTQQEVPCVPSTHHTTTDSLLLPPPPHQPASQHTYMHAPGCLPAYMAGIMHACMLQEEGGVSLPPPPFKLGRVAALSSPLLCLSSPPLPLSPSLSLSLSVLPPSSCSAVALLVAAPHSLTH